MTLEELTKAATRLDAESFARAFPAPAFLVTASADSGEEDVFRTIGHLRREALSVTEATAHASRIRDEVPQEDTGPCVVAWFVVKSDRNPFAQMITIGRAENNDIVLNHAAVSKMHAHVTASGNQWVIEDHSSNGTFIDGQRLVTGQRKALEDGHVVRFGTSVCGRYHTPTGLHRVLLSGDAEDIARLGSGVVRLPKSRQAV